MLWDRTVFDEADIWHSGGVRCKEADRLVVSDGLGWVVDVDVWDEIAGGVKIDVKGSGGGSDILLEDG